MLFYLTKKLLESERAVYKRSRWPGRKKHSQNRPLPERGPETASPGQMTELNVYLSLVDNDKG